jgi:hypothetical protein
MLGFFTDLKEIVYRGDKVSTENLTFWLHTRVTVLFLLAASCLAAAKQGHDSPNFVSDKFA